MNTLYRFCRNTLHGIALVLTAGIFLLNIFYSSVVASTGYETVSVFSHAVAGVLMVAAVVCAVLLLRFSGLSARMPEEKKLFRVLAVLYSLLAAYLILNVDSTLRADAKQVFQAAQAVKFGSYAAFEPGQYLSRYPHQLGLMQYDRLLMLFSENPQFVFLVNFLLVLGINHTGWKLSAELFSDPAVNVLTILLSFAFLPQFFFILFAYGLIPGFFFLQRGFLHTVRYVRQKRIRDLVAMILCVGIAVLLKQNFLIGGIAIGIFLFLRILQEKYIPYLAAMLLLFPGMLLPAEALQLCYEKAADVKLDDPSPAVLWITMGTDIDNTLRGPGWYDSSSWNLYNAAGFDAELASEYGKQKLAENWKKIQAEPARAGTFFLEKTASQWCDPLYESTWSGPLADCGQNTHTDILRSVYSGGTWSAGIALLMKLLCLMLWGFAAMFLLFRGSMPAGWEPMYLYFIGGLLFHTFWEGKSQYTYPYLFVLIPFSAVALCRAIRRRK